MLKSAEQAIDGISDYCAQRRAYQYVTQEMQAEHNARERNTEGAEQQSCFERWIKEEQGNGHRKRRHRVARRE